MTSATLIIARLTFREAARRKVLLAALLLGLLFLIVYGIGFHLMLKQADNPAFSTDQLVLNQIQNFLLMAGMYVVNFLTVMMSVLVSVDSLSGEINSGTIHTVLSKPLRRWEVLLGKWLGFTIMLSLYLLLMGGGIMAIIYLRSGYTAPNALPALALLWLNAILLLSVSLSGSTRLSTLANGVLVFGLFGVSFIGGWIEQIGTMIPNSAFGETARNIGVITSLLLPSEALWKRAAHELQSPLMAALGFSPFASNSYPSDLMLIYSALYLVVILRLAIHWFKRRDV